MGYLIGFLFATFIAGYLDLKKNIFIIFFKLTISCFGNLYILVLFWLGNLIGWDKPIVQLGVNSFFIG